MAIAFAGSVSHGQQQAPLLDEDVKMVSFADVAYPAWAVNTKIQGVVVVSVKLDASGAVTSTSALSGPKALIPVVEANALRWRFRPNAQSAAIVVYNFRIDDGACHDAAKSTFLLQHQNFATIVACTPVAVGD
jgi:hypothetical protein